MSLNDFSQCCERPTGLLKTVRDSFWRTRRIFPKRANGIQCGNDMLYSHFHPTSGVALVLKMEFV